MLTFGIPQQATGLYGAKLECRWLSSRRELRAVKQPGRPVAMPLRRTEYSCHSCLLRLRTIPVRKAPGVEEFQIVENKSWARRFFPVDGGDSQRQRGMSQMHGPKRDESELCIRSVDCRPERTSRSELAR